ncbi:MAG: hypothetical protein AUI10_03745 [Actinobacteria bacterium 13_2_20CM_2_72_6]|nr:MAG: hypothetical protein AUI10_03745 [Actinobacteria bacterium 13_2_20CM_2_72_6]
MISAEEFCAGLDRAGIGLVTGVPCSFFGGPLRLLERQPGRYVPAANEGAALAIATGAQLTGRRSAVLIQNSGFGNLVNPLTSLLMTFELPALVFMSLRGWPDPAQDEPQHAVMGRTTHALLDALGVPYRVLGPSFVDLVDTLDAAPAFVLVPRGTLAPAPSIVDAPPEFGRREALAALVPYLGDALVFSTTGYISRELYGLADRPETFYMQGSMGHALALGLGAALSRPDRRVVVVDGDGAVQMHLGTCVTVGATEPDLLHVVLDNGAYESTGGQPATPLDWLSLGATAGYRTATMCTSAADLTKALSTVDEIPGPHLVVARIGTAPAVTPPRVTSGLSPVELRQRFQAAAHV